MGVSRANAGSIDGDDPTLEERRRICDLHRSDLLPVSRIACLCDVISQSTWVDLFSQIAGGIDNHCCRCRPISDFRNDCGYREYACGKTTAPNRALMNELLPRFICPRTARWSSPRSIFPQGKAAFRTSLCCCSRRTLRYRAKCACLLDWMTLNGLVRDGHILALIPTNRSLRALCGSRIANNFDGRTGDQPAVNHLVEVGNQRLNLLFCVNHAHHDGAFFEMDRLRA